VTSCDKKLIPDEREQVAINRIRELHARGASLRFIAAALDSDGHRPKRGTRWHPETVKRVLART
jgi:hypothetical protein